MNVTLEDDGTLDTVLTVDGKHCRFSQEYASYYRDEDGTLRLDELVRDNMDYLEELVEDDEFSAMAIV